MTPNMSHQRMSTSLEELLPVQRDTIQIESQLSLVNKRQRWAHVSHNDDQNPVCFSHCWLLVVDSHRQLLPRICRGWGQQKGYIQKRMYELDECLEYILNILWKLDLVKCPNCTLILTIEVQFYNSTFLPHENHLASSISLPESSTRPKKWGLC